MWIVGVSALLLISAGVSVLLALRERPTPALPLWDVTRVAGAYTGIAGTLSGFTVASAVFIADVTRGSLESEGAVGLFILAFLMLIASTMLFATTPNLTGELTQHYLSGRHLSYMMANTTFFVGTALSWLGLRLLLLAIGFSGFAGTLTWVLFAVLVLASLRLSMHLYRHTTINAMACFALLPMALGLAFLYWTLGDSLDVLWPDQDQPLAIATVAFFVAGAAYAIQTLLLALHGHRGWEELVARTGQRWTIAHAQASVTVIFLLWLAVAEA
jgi:hypothetical protein